MGLVARVGTRVAGRYTSAGLEVREALPVSRDFFGATPSQLAQGNSSVFNPPPLVLLQPRNHATGRYRSGCTVAQLQESVWRGVGTREAGKTPPDCCPVGIGLPKSAQFLELAA